MANEAAAQEGPGLKTVVTASAAGTAFEWYDFFIFGSLAAVLARQHLIPRTEGWYPGRPVMVIQNDYSTGLMNGDVGICLPRYEQHQGQWQHRLRVVFPAVEAGQPVRWI